LAYVKDIVMSRCLNCNSPVITTHDKQQMVGKLKQELIDINTVFKICTNVYSNCGKVFYAPDESFEHTNYKTAKEWAQKFSFY